MQRELTRLADAVAFLRQKGSKAAIQVGPDGGYVFVEKSDLLKMIRYAQQTGHADFENYDGETVFVWVGDREKVLYLPNEVVLLTPE